MATATIYLADGRQVRADVNSTAPFDGSGSVFVQGREIRVAPLPDLFRMFGYGELVSIVLQSGERLETVLLPEQYRTHAAYLYPDKESIEATICVFDQGAGFWRELTEQEYAQERRALEADAQDMAQIECEWREYREEHLLPVGGQIPPGARERQFRRIIEGLFAIAAPGTIKNSLWAAYQAMVTEGKR